MERTEHYMELICTVTLDGKPIYRNTAGYRQELSEVCELRFNGDRFEEFFRKVALEVFFNNVEVCIGPLKVSHCGHLLENSDTKESRIMVKSIYDVNDYGTGREDISNKK